MYQQLGNGNTSNLSGQLLWNCVHGVCNQNPQYHSRNEWMKLLWKFQNQHVSVVTASPVPISSSSQLVPVSSDTNPLKTQVCGKIPSNSKSHCTFVYKRRFIGGKKILLLSPNFAWCTSGQSHWEVLYLQVKLWGKRFSILSELCLQIAHVICLLISKGLSLVSIQTLSKHLEFFINSKFFKFCVPKTT